MGTKELELARKKSYQETHLLNPFPGLRPFSYEESHLFFGREGQSDEILEKLSRNRFISVIGASGSGKSSLMFCGLMPVLYGGFLGPAGSEWLVITSRPGNTPIENLAESVLRISAEHELLTPEEKETEKLITNIVLRSSSYGLVDVLKPITRKKKKPINILLLIDQFEELFRYIKSGIDSDSTNNASAFVHLILKSIRQTELPIYAAITMRSDFIGECAQFPDLTHVINKSHYLIPQMTRDQQKMAIEGPIAVGGGKITKRLVQQLLNEVGNNPDQLPIMQHALMRTWEYWLHNKDENESIDTRHYVAIGKLDEALSQHANETYIELDKKDREICDLIFKSLTEKGRENYGIRRGATVAELTSITGVTEQEVIKVIEKFRKPGRSLLMPPSNIPLKSNVTIEISHESLMRIWDRLKNWVDEEHESAQMYRRLSEAASMYQIGRTGLWRPPDLQLALNWQKKQAPTRAWAQRYNPFFERAILFLETSKTAYENEQKSKELLQKNMLKRTRTVAVVLGIAAVISIVFFIFALYQKIDADDKAKLAENNARLVGRENENAKLQAAEARRLQKIADIQTGKAVKAQQETLLQKQAADEQRTRAENEQAIADKQRKYAEQQAARADTATKEANAARLVAENNFREKNKLLYLSTAQNMAIKSLQVNDPLLKGLMAQQAFIFNTQYEGNLYDRYIYEGLYYALKSLTYDSLYLLKGHRGIIRDLAVSSDGNKLYSVSTDGRIIAWDISHPAYARKEFPELKTTRKTVAKLTSDGGWLIVGNDASEILCFDLKNDTSKPIEVKGHEGTILDIAILPGDKYFISLSSDRTLRFSDFMNSQLLKKFSEPYKRMSLSPDGKFLALAAENGKLILLDTKNVDKEYTILPAGGPAVRSLSFNPKGNFLAVGNINGIVRLIDLSRGPESPSFPYDLTGHLTNAYINDVEFSKDGNFLVSAGFDGIIQMWNMMNLENLPVIMHDHNSQVWSLAISDDSNYIFAGCQDGSIKIWPTHPAIMADQICGKLTRNMTREEWFRYGAQNVPYEQTCLTNNR